MSEITCIGTGSTTSCGLYKLSEQDEDSETCAISLAVGIVDWHEWMAHSDVTGIRCTADKVIVKGLRIAPGVYSLCSGCILCKSHRLSIPKSRQCSSTSLLELVRSDVTGPFEFKTLDDSRYVVTFIDDYSK